MSAIPDPATPASPVPADGLPAPERFRAMTVIIVGIAMSVLDSTIVNLALPAIARELNSTPAHAVWVVNAYQLGTLVLLLPCATLGDLVGYRRVYLAGVALFTLSSAACVLASSLPMLALSRAVQGLAAAGIMSMNSALVRLTNPSDRLGRAIALNSVVVATASVAGPSLAAAVLSVASWPWLFAINLPVGAFVLALGWRALPDNPGPAPAGVRLSGVDVVLNVSMFALIVLGTDTLGARAGASPAAGALAAGAALLGAGLAVGVVYVRRQWREPIPLLPIDLLRIPVFALSIATSVAAFAAQTLSFVALPFLLLDSYGQTPLQAGLLLTAWPLAIVLTAPLAGRLIGRYPGGLLAGVGLALLAAGLALLAGLGAQPARADIAWRLVICGVGFGLFQSPNNHQIVTSAPLGRSGAAGGMLGSARLTGQTAGAVLLGIIFTMAGTRNGHGPLLAVGLGAGFALVASLVSFLRLRHVPERT